MSRSVHWTKIVKQTAQQLSLPEEQVKELILWYWKYYRKELTKLERTKLFMPGFGTFYAKHWKLEKRMAELRQSIRTTQNHGGNLKKWALCDKYREEFKRVKALNDVFKEEKKRKETIRKKQNEMREEFYPTYLAELKAKGTVDEKVINYLEEQEKNQRRDSEHPISKTVHRRNSKEPVGDM